MRNFQIAKNSTHMKDMYLHIINSGQTTSLQMDFFSDSQHMSPLFEDDHELAPYIAFKPVQKQINNTQLVINIPIPQINFNTNNSHNSESSILNQHKTDQFNHNQIKILPVFDVITLPKVIKFSNTPQGSSSSDLTFRKMKNSDNYDLNDINMFDLDF